MMDGEEVRQQNTKHTFDWIMAQARLSHLPKDEFLVTPVGSKLVADFLRVELTRAIMTERHLVKHMGNTFFRVHDSMRKELDDFLLGMRMKPCVDAAMPVISAARVTSLAILQELGQQIQGGFVHYGSFRNITAIVPNVRSFQVGRGLYEFMADQFLFRHKKEEQYVENGITVFECCNNVSLSDIISYHFSREVVENHRKTFIVIPYSDELLRLLVNAKQLGTCVEHKMPYFDVTANAEWVVFRTREKTTQFSMYVDSYIEIVTRNRVMTNLGDVQIETHANRPGWLILKMLDVPVQFRKTEIELSLETTLGRSNFVLVHSFSFCSKTLERKEFLIERTFYQQVLKYARSAAKLDYRDLKTTAAKYAQTVVAVNGVRKLVAKYEPDEIVAVTQAIFREEYKRVYEMTTLIRSFKSEMASSTGGHVNYGKLAEWVAIVASVAVSVGIPFAGGGLLGTLVSSAVAGFFVTRNGIESFSEIILEFVKTFSHLYLSEVNELELPSYYEFYNGEKAKPLVERRLKGGFSFEQIRKVVAPVRVFVRGKELNYMQLRGGDIFDLDDNTYVVAVESILSTDRVLDIPLFSKKAIAGLETKAGDLWSNRTQKELVALTTLPAQHIAIADYKSVCYYQLYYSGNVIWAKGIVDFAKGKQCIVTTDLMNNTAGEVATVYDEQMLESGADFSKIINELRPLFVPGKISFRESKDPTLHYGFSMDCGITTLRCAEILGIEVERWLANGYVKTDAGWKLDKAKKRLGLWSHGGGELVDQLQMNELLCVQETCLAVMEKPEYINMLLAFGFVPKLKFTTTGEIEIVDMLRKKMIGSDLVVHRVSQLSVQDMRIASQVYVQMGFSKPASLLIYRLILDASKTDVSVEVNGEEGELIVSYRGLELHYRFIDKSILEIPKVRCGFKTDLEKVFEEDWYPGMPLFSTLPMVFEYWYRLDSGIGV